MTRTQATPIRGVMTIPTTMTEEAEASGMDGCSSGNNFGYDVGRAWDNLWDFVGYVWDKAAYPTRTTGEKRQAVRGSS